MDGSAELAEQVFNLPVRVGYPRNVGGLKDVVNSPKFATAVGLLCFGSDMASDSHKIRIRDKNLFDSVLSSMKRWVSDIF